MSVMMATMHNPSLDNPYDNDQLEAPPSQRDYGGIYRGREEEGRGRERGLAEGISKQPGQHASIQSQHINHGYFEAGGWSVGGSSNISQWEGYVHCFVNASIKLVSTSKICA